MDTQKSPFTFNATSSPIPQNKGRAIIPSLKPITTTNTTTRKGSDEFQQLSPKAHDKPQLTPQESRKRRINTRKVYICNLPKGIDVPDLRELMLQFGPIQSAYICNQKRKGNFVYGFVVFRYKDSAEEAVSTARLFYAGSKIVIKWAALEAKKKQKRKTENGGGRGAHRAGPRDSEGSNEAFRRRREPQNCYAEGGNRSRAGRVQRHGKAHNETQQRNRALHLNREGQEEVSYVRKNSPRAPQAENSNKQPSSPIRNNKKRSTRDYYVPRLELFHKIRSTPGSASLKQHKNHDRINIEFKVNIHYSRNKFGPCSTFQAFSFAKRRFQ